MVAGIVVGLSVAAAGFLWLAVIGWQRWSRERAERLADRRRREGWGSEVMRLISVEDRRPSGR